MSTSAHERKCCQFNHAARDIANSLFQKWAIKGFFPAGEQSEPRQRTARRAPAGRSPRRAAGRAASGVAVPLCFLWYFLSLRKKVLPPRGGSPTVRAGVGASSPSSGRCMPTGAPENFPRGKQSARFALPCAPLVVCLNSGSLTAFGGCIHWIPASLRSPLETFWHRSWRENPWDGKSHSRTEVGAPDPCKGPLRSIVFPRQISPMESLLLFLDIPLFGAPTPRCRIAFFSFFSLAAESKRSPPSSRLNPAPSWYVFSVGNPRLRKRSGTTFRSGFSLFFS